jgi:hypothetical protein
MNDQQQLVRAIFNKNSSLAQDSDFEDSGFEHLEFEERGLAIYRKNLKANAVRALHISFPTLLKLIGDDLFTYAVEQLLKTDTLNSGDWGLWGDSFPELLETLSALNEFPYVIDIARLDFLMHIQSREKDSYIDMASMTLLADYELDQLRLVLNPSIRILESNYPVTEIYQANNQPEYAEEFLNKAQQKLASNIGESCLIYRPKFKPLIRALDSAELNWLRLIQQEKSIGQSLDELLMKNQEFSFEKWLPLAVQQNLIFSLNKM